jgi:TP901 family phage tail tape measure protein
MQSVGGGLSRSLTLPLVAAGLASVKMAFDFDKSMTQIKALVGVAGDEVDAMGQRAKQMALDTGKSATEAGDALFYITSAGLRGEEAMQVLEASLKAAAVGLGETKTIADLATSAMNAYGRDSLSASQATDILTAAVREGKLEGECLGRINGRGYSNCLKFRSWL